MGSIYYFLTPAFRASRDVSAKALNPIGPQGIILRPALHNDFLFCVCVFIIIGLNAFGRNVLSTSFFFFLVVVVVN